MNTHKTPFFFSLKWKAALGFGAVLLLFNLLFPAMVYWNLQQKFELSRDTIQQQYQQQLSGQLQNTSSNLQRLAELSLLAGNSNKQDIIKALNKSQSKLELDWHTSQAQLYTHDGYKLGGWGKDAPAHVIKLISRVQQSETATTIIDCQKGCKQYDIIPVLIDKKSTLVLLLAYDMSNALLDFTHNTAADVAVLTKQASIITTEEQSIPQWDMHISALTSFQKNSAYLRTLATNHSLEKIIRDKKIIRDTALPVEFNFILTAHNDNIMFVIIDDISQQKEDIHTLIIQSLLVSLLGIILFGTALFLFIARPLRRLSSVSKALPILAHQRYEHVRNLISHRIHRYSIDELDQLEDSTYELTEQLENLHISVLERMKSLQQSSLELKQERDFVKNLINTAQLIIVTIDRQCNVTSFNDFAERITGYLESDILNSSFQRFFPAGEWPDIQASLIELKNTPDSISQQETEFIHHDGSIRTISWLHSSLNHPTDASVILSVGLDITDKKHSDDKIIWLADHDALTELFNRRKFNIEFEFILNTAQRFNHTGMLLFLDLDQFKDINDTYGHKMGDQVLKNVASILTSIIRSTDIISRLGGDEFAIILPEINSIGAITLAKKIAAEFSSANFEFNGAPFKVSCSIGLVEFPLGDLSVEELISNADLAMYQAKARGKNTWHQFNVDDQTRLQLQTRVLWKHRIEDAIENNRFIFYYQPIMNINSRTVSHYEMLIRMQDPDGTIHPPQVFIQVAEDTGLIHHIDHLVLYHGITKQAELDASGAEILLSINLSGYAIDDTQLLPLLKRILKDTQANPKHLIFELTETAAVADIMQAKELMLQLIQLGCRFSLDDFGTGFASFRYMRELPVDIVKIDGSFIANLANNPDDQLFVKALVDVAKGMGKKTIAEFVENAETLALLKEIGVDYAQGYYIGKPQPYFLDGPPILK